jgi:alanine-alpha-ketoisovalerate/valine-pyruvate aminotransferase
MKKENFSLSDNCDFDVLTIYHQILVYTIREKNPKGNVLIQRELETKKFDIVINCS